MYFLKYIAYIYKKKIVEEITSKQFNNVIITIIYI